MSDPLGPSNPPDAAARSRLLGVKLRALVSDHHGDDRRDAVAAAEAFPFPGGTALLVADESGIEAWVLVDHDASGSLGATMAWAIRHGAQRLHVVADAGTGVLARRAERVTFPVTVWFAVEGALLPAVPEPLAAPRSAEQDHLALAPLITGSGADLAVEHGVVFGEVRGLEVCRVVGEPTTGTFAEPTTGTIADPGDAPAPPQRADVGGAQLEVGVGANDREAFRLLHGDVPTVEALAAVVGSVSSYRRDDAPQHPLNRLARERYLRWRLQQMPELVGMDAVVPAEPPVPRPNVKDAVPCVASATAGDGTSATIVCSTGIDLDLVGFVADVHASGADRVVVALPSRDVVPITRELLDTLIRPVDVVAVG